jgi:predicted aspartyl protease
LKAGFPYDGRLDPPGPVLPVRIATPGSESAVVLEVLLDTGADCTLVPRALARTLGLPAVDQVWVEGVGGSARRATVHAARVEFGGVRCLARVVGFGDEAVLGRDLLNRVVALLDGPAGRCSLSRPRARSRQK